MNCVTLHVCGECKGADLSALQKLLPGTMTLRKSPCLDACERPVALTLQGRGAAYIFHGVDLEKHAADIVATAQTYISSPDGWIEDARPCGHLRFCLRARLPSALGT